MPNPSNPQNFNRFGYVLNNPINLIDPSGYVCVNNGGTNDEVAMSGNCGGAPNPNWNGQVTPSPSGWTGGGNGNTNDENRGSEGIVSPLSPGPACIALSFCSIPTASYGNGLIGPPVPPGVYFGSKIANDLVYPWETNRLDGIGYRFNASYWYYVAGVDFSLDVIYNFNSGELSTLPTIAPINLGIGGGGDVAPIGAVFVYDAPNNDALTGGSGSISANVTAISGLQASYSSSASPGYTGQYAQTYYVGIPFGTEFSLGAGYGVTPFNWQIINP